MSEKISKEKYQKSGEQARKIYRNSNNIDKVFVLKAQIIKKVQEAGKGR